MKIFKSLLSALIFTTLTLFSSVAFASSITYNSVDKSISILGEINIGDFDIFKKLVDANPDTTKVIITSPGGAFLDGEKIGYLIYIKKLPVEARDYCFSSCAYIWLASPDKSVSYTTQVQGGPYIGIHMPFNGDNGQTDISGVAEAAWYLGKIGLPDKVIQDIKNVTQPSMYIIGPQSTIGWDLGQVKIIDLTNKK